MAQTVKITPASGLLEFIGNNTSNKPYLQHDDNGNLTLTLQATKKFIVSRNLKVNGKVTMAQQTLTDGAAITWDFNSGANATVTLAGARTLVIANMETGDTGLILVKQDSAGGRTLILPGSSTIVGGGSYTASSAANATDVLGVYYDGTTYWWTIGYNTVTPPLTSVGITGGDFVIANSPLTSNGNIGLALATVNSNVGTFGSATAVPVITVNAKGLVTAVSATNISIPTNLDSLTDVTISSAASGQLLQFNGSQWVNWTPNYLTSYTETDTLNTVTGRGNVTTNTIDVGGVKSDYFLFDTAATPSLLPGMMRWNDSDGTAEIALKYGEVVLQLGQETHYVVRNSTGSTIKNGTAVYASGVTAGSGRIEVSPYIADGSIREVRFLGLATHDISNGVNGVVTHFGYVRDLDTRGTAVTAISVGDEDWTVGDILYVHPTVPGKLTNVKPKHEITVAIVINRHQSSGVLLVRPSSAGHLDDIHDVILNSESNGQLLKYDSTAGAWVNWTPNYLTAESDTFSTVTGRGSSTSSAISITNLTQSTGLNTGALTVAGGVAIGGNLYVGGNLVIGGTTTTINAANLAVSDNMIYLNNGIATTISNAVGNGTSVVYTTIESHNYVVGMSVSISGITPSAYNLSNQTITAVGANSFTISNSATGSYSSGGTARARSNANPDLGFAAGYYSGSYAHTGLFRDATDDTYKFFKGYVPEPDASPFIDTAHASFAYADLRADNITGRSFIKDGGTSSQFLKADGTVDSSTYLTTGTASSTYQPLDADLTAIAALTSTGLLRRTSVNTWALDASSYLTAESDTLATVTGRGASTSTPVTFNGNVTLGNSADLVFVDLAGTFPTSGKGFDWTLNNDGARIYAIQPSSDSIDLVFQLRDNATVNDRFVFWVDDYTGPAGDKYPLIIRGGTEVDLVDAGLFIRGTQVLTNGRVLQNVTGNISMFTNDSGYITGYTETDTLASVTARGATTNTTLTLGKVITTGLYGHSLGGNNPIWQYDAGNLGYGIVYNEGSPDTLRIDVSGQAVTGTPDFLVGPDYAQVNGNTVWHAGNLTNLNQLTNGPGYITGYTETDTLASVTGRGATTNTASIFRGGLYAQKAQDDGNYTTAALWTESYDTTTTGIAFHISGVVGKFLEMRLDQTLYWDNEQVWHTGNLTNLNQLTNGPGYITGYTETDPTVPSHVKAITTTNISNWNTAYSWGNHAGLYATQAYVNTAVSNLVDSAPGTLDTLNELAAALGDDPNFATTISTSISGKVAKAGDTMTGTLTINRNVAGLIFNRDAVSNYNGIYYSTAAVPKWFIGMRENLGLNNHIHYSEELGRDVLTLDVTTGNATVFGTINALNFSGSSSGTNTGDQTTITGNAGSATILQTARTLTIGATGKTFNGSANVAWSLAEIGAWHAGNDGAGSGLDADLLDGYHASGSVGANTVVIRDVNGYIYANYINTNVGVDNPSIANFITDNGDGWMRKSSLAHVRNSLGNYGGWLTQAAADPLYVNVTGDSMTGPLVITGSTSGQELFAVNGVNGRLFTVTDDLSNSLFSVNTVAGLPVIEAFANNTVNLGPFSAPIVINASGISTPSHGTSANWHSAYNDVITSAAVSGTTTKTLTLTQRDGGTVTASWTDIDTDTDTNTDQQTLSISGSTLTISGGNSVTIPSGGISQATADTLYVSVNNNTSLNSDSRNRRGVTRLYRYDDDSDYSVQHYWTGSYWHLRGFNGDAFHADVQVGYADNAGNAATANALISMNISQFTNNSGYITSYSETDTLASVTGRGATTSTAITLSGGSGTTPTLSLDRNIASPSNYYNGVQLEVKATSGTAGIGLHRNGFSHVGIYHDAVNTIKFDMNSGTVIINHNAGTVWGSGNDGAGSGLDADLLDGLNATTLATASTVAVRDSSGNLYANYILGTYANFSQGNSENPTIGQIWTQNTSDNYLRKSTPSHFRSQVTDGYYLSLSGGTVNGNVNINGQLAFLDGNNGYSNIIRSAAYPSEGFPDGTNYWLEYNSWGGHHFILNADGGVGASLASPDDFVIWQGAIDGDRLLEVSNTGTLTIADRLIELSSIRYKTQVESLTPALDKVLQLRPVHYVKIGGTGSTEIGLIAEEVAEIYPELIKYNNEGEVDGINYTRIAPILIKTIQEQQELIKNLTKRIDDLENR